MSSSVECPRGIVGDNTSSTSKMAITNGDLAGMKRREQVKQACLHCRRRKVKVGKFWHLGCWPIILLT